MFKSFSLAGLAALLLSAPAQAAVVTFSFSGLIDEVTGSFASPVSAGDRFTGSYTFDSETPDSNPSDVLGEYTNSGAPYGLQISFGGNSVSYDNVTQGVRSDQFNSYSVGAVNDIAPDSDFSIVSLVFADPVAGFTSDELPTSLPLDDRFITRTIDFFSEEAGGGFQGRLSPVINQIPEPSEILGTVALGVIGVGFYLRKKKKPSDIA